MIENYNNVDSWVDEVESCWEELKHGFGKSMSEDDVVAFLYRNIPDAGIYGPIKSILTMQITDEAHR